MHTEVAVVLVEGLESGDIRSSFHDFIHPFDGPHHLVSLCLSEDWRTLVLCNFTLKEIMNQLKIKGYNTATDRNIADIS